MLVLARRKEESIVIGDDIVVTILGVEGEKVKLGIEAPNSIRIWRKEIHEAIVDQMMVATKIASRTNEPDSFSALRELLTSDAEDQQPGKKSSQKDKG